MVEPNPSEKNMLVKLDPFPQFSGVQIKKNELPPPRISSIMKTRIFGMLPFCRRLFAGIPGHKVVKKTPDFWCYYCFKQHRLPPQCFFPSLKWLPKPWSSKMEVKSVGEASHQPHDLRFPWSQVATSNLEVHLSCWSKPLEPALNTEQLDT